MLSNASSSMGVNAPRAQKARGRAEGEDHRVKKMPMACLRVFIRLVWRREGQFCGSEPPRGSMVP